MESFKKATISISGVFVILCLVRSARSCGSCQSHWKKCPGKPSYCCPPGFPVCHSSSFYCCPEDHPELCPGRKKCAKKLQDCPGENSRIATAALVDPKIAEDRKKQIAHLP